MFISNGRLVIWPHPVEGVVQVFCLASTLEWRTTTKSMKSMPLRSASEVIGKSTPSLFEDWWPRIARSTNTKTEA